MYIVHSLEIVVVVVVVWLRFPYFLFIKLHECCILRRVGDSETTSCLPRQPKMFVSQLKAFKPQ